MWEDRVLVLVPLMLILQQALSVRNVSTPNQNVIICSFSVHLYVRYSVGMNQVRYQCTWSPTFEYVYKRTLKFSSAHV